MGLDWSKINLKDCSIIVEQALTYIPKQGQSINDTKNTSSDRKISIPIFVKELLEKYKTQQKKES